MLDVPTNRERIVSRDQSEDAQIPRCPVHSRFSISTMYLNDVGHGGQRNTPLHRISVKELLNREKHVSRSLTLVNDDTRRVCISFEQVNHGTRTKRVSNE